MVFFVGWYIIGFICTWLVLQMVWYRIAWLFVCLFWIQNYLGSFASSFTDQKFYHSWNYLLRVIDLPTGKTRWYTGPGKRNLIEADLNSMTKFNASDLQNVSPLQVTDIRTLALSAWCSFVGTSWCYSNCWHDRYNLYYLLTLLRFLILSYNGSLSDRCDTSYTYHVSN